MVHNINVRIEDAKLEEFLKIIESFKNLGLVKDYDEAKAENEIIGSRSDEELLEMIEISRKQIAEGKGLTTAEAKKQIRTWQQRR